MQHRTTVKLTAIAAVLLCSLTGGAAFGQSTGQYSQTVNKAPTVTEVFMPRGMLPEQAVTPKALVHTGISTSGIVTPTPNITFYVDGTGSGNVIGTPTLTSATATNHLNYSESFSKWKLGGLLPHRPSPINLRLAPSEPPTLPTVAILLRWSFSQTLQAVLFPA